MKMGTEPDIAFSRKEDIMKNGDGARYCSSSHANNHSHFSNIPNPPTRVIPLLTSLFLGRPGVPSRTDLVSKKKGTD